MIAPSFPLLVRAEIQKLLSRASTRMGLVLSAAIGTLMPAFVAWLVGGVSVNGGQPGSALPDTAAVWMEMALFTRNLFPLPAMVVVLGAVSFAGEYQARTLREDLLRPVSRSLVLLAKWIALCVFVVLSVLVTAATSAAFGVVMCGTGGEWRPVLLSFAGTIPTECGFAVLVLTVSVLTRSVVGTVAGTMLFMVANGVVGGALGALEALRRANPFGTEFEWPAWVDIAILLRPWLPPWPYLAWLRFRPGMEELVPVSSWFALVLISVVLGGIAAWRFERTDVP